MGLCLGAAVRLDGKDGLVVKPVPAAGKGGGSGRGRLRASSSSAETVVTVAPEMVTVNADTIRDWPSSETLWAGSTMSTCSTSSVSSRRNSKRRTSFEDRYEFGAKLGEGALAVVRAGERKVDGKEYAIKILDKKKLTPDEVTDLLQEVEVLRFLRHPNIIRFEEFAEDRTNYYLVMELVKGGELLDRITVKTVYTEKEARDLFVAMVSTVVYMHANDVVHRDLKPENLLMDGRDDTTIKIADFGFAARVDGEKKCLRKRCGSPGYIAPEILRGDAYGKSVDMWSVGVITFILLGGYPPFYDRSEKRLYEKIKAGQYEFHHDIWDSVSDEAKDLIRGLLCVDVNDRLTAIQALRHPWVKMASAVLRQRSLEHSHHEMRMFNARRKFRSGVLKVMANNRMSRLLSKLREAARQLSLENAMEKETNENATAPADQ